MLLCFNWSLVSTFWCPQNFSINSANHCGKIHLKKIMLQNVNVVTQRRDFLISIFCNVPITELKRKSLKRTGKNHFQLLLLLSHWILQRWLYYCEHLKRLQCLLCCNQSHASSLHYRNHKQWTVSYRPWNKLFSFCFNIHSFYKWTITFPAHLFTVCAIIAKNTGLSDFGGF